MTAQQLKRRFNTLLDKTINVTANLISLFIRLVPYLIVIGCALGVLVNGVMVGVTLHKPALCYSFATWWCGIVGVLYLILLLILKMTVPIK